MLTDSKRLGVKPVRTLLSTKIRIFVTDEVRASAVIIGAIQRISPRQTRTLRRIKEVGTDGFLEIVPTQPAETTLDVERIAYDRRRLPGAFGRNFQQIQAQRFPFSVAVQEFGAAPADEASDTGADAYDTVNLSLYEDCWIQDYGSTYTQDDYVVAETATIWCTRMSMYYSTGADPKAELETSLDFAQELVDEGKDLGALDQPNPYAGDTWFGTNSDLYARLTGLPGGAFADTLNAAEAAALNIV